MKTRTFPVNPNCPLSDEEKEKISKLLDEIELEAYAPIKHLSSGYADAIVNDYDEFEIRVEVEYGVDSDGRHDTEYIQIERMLL